ncbi:MAG: M23 family metallopeptidase [Vicingaceae bacterium]
MEEKEPKNKKILKRLKNKYRLVILNDATFEERFSYRLSPLNIFTLIITMAVFLMASVVVVIVFTPLREFIPGYTDVSLREDLTKMVLKSDSLERELQQNELYLANISAILKGEDPSSLDSMPAETLDPQSVGNPAVRSKEDSMLRDYVEREDSYSLRNEQSNAKSIAAKLYFFTPLKGSVTNEYNPTEQHYGIDVVAPKNEAIKATLEGTVIFANWTVETGYVIQVQHSNDLLSIYKHNSVLLKKTGDFVKAGEPIAIIGNSGELSSGPHLHFELWRSGTPLNPTQFVTF